MTSFWIIFFLFLGLAILIKGADIFVDGSAGLAKKLGISDFFIGATLVALGTSLPEFIVSLLAGFSKNGELVIGNIIGSNIANIALVLGICAIIKTIKIQSEKLTKREIPFVILSGVILFVLGFDQIFRNHGTNNNYLTAGDGIILLAFFAIFLFYIAENFRRSNAEKTQTSQKKKIHTKESILLLSIKIIGGLLAVIGGGKIVVDNAIDLASLLGVSQEIIGLTIVAIGTSLPEAITTIIAVKKQKEGIAIGNIIGSNTLNVFFILGTVATFTPLKLSPSMMIDVSVMILISIMLFLMSYYRKEIGRFSGVALLISYSAYLLFVGLREFYIERGIVVL